MNTDAKRWATDNFEVAKCFLPKGYGNRKSLEKVDMVGLLNICINCRKFSKWIANWDQPKNTATKVRLRLTI